MAAFSLKSESIGRQSSDHVGEVGIFRGQSLATTRFIVSVLEPWRHGASEERELAARLKATPLPHAARHHHLQLLAVEQIRPEHERPPLPLFIQLQHAHGIAEIEMKNLIGLQSM